MLGLIRALFSFFGEFARYFADRQLMEAGKKEGAVEAMKEVEARVEQAKSASTVDAAGVLGGDVVRLERMRNRFDRSRNRP